MKSKSMTRVEERVSPLGDLESRLSQFFTPVEPRQRYIEDLKSRLDEVKIRRRLRLNQAQMAFLAIASLVSGVALIVTGVRVFVTLLGAVGIVQYARQRSEERRGARVQTAL